MKKTIAGLLVATMAVGFSAFTNSIDFSRYGKPKGFYRAQATAQTPPSTSVRLCFSLTQGGFA